jgi:DNA-binding GntR family transcriptional regulator
MNQPLARTMSGQITTRIREKILTGLYPPGAPLLQDAIAAEFGVSKIPVREALVQLRSEGLVDIFAHRGFVVRPVSAAEMEEVFRLRLAIEPGAVAEGARQAVAEDRAVAKTALDAFATAVADGGVDRAGDLNYAFHLALAVPRVQPVTGEVLFRLHTLSQRYVHLHLQPAGRIKRAIRRHRVLYDAWAARKVREAKRLTEEHIEEIRTELAAALA